MPVPVPSLSVFQLMSALLISMMEKLVRAQVGDHQMVMSTSDQLKNRLGNDHNNNDRHNDHLSDHHNKVKTSKDHKEVNKDHKVNNDHNKVNSDLKVSNDQLKVNNDLKTSDLSRDLLKPLREHQNQLHRVEQPEEPPEDQLTNDQLNDQQKHLKENKLKVATRTKGQITIQEDPITILEGQITILARIKGQITTQEDQITTQLPLKNRITNPQRRNHITLHQLQSRPQSIQQQHQKM